MLADVDQGGTTNFTVTVYSGLLYHKDVSLRAEYEPYIDVCFSPKILKHGDKPVSMVRISAEKEAPLGEHLISIVSNGADGKEHICKFTLNVSGSTPTPAETPNPKITIIYPSNMVHRHENITGTAKNIPKESHMWVVVYPHIKNRYYPMGEVEHPNGEWVCFATIGSPDKNEVGARFDIIVILADNQKTQEKLEKDRDSLRNDNDWGGASDIPGGAKEFTRVTVTRV